jgi:hypothetical protein
MRPVATLMAPHYCMQDELVRLVVPPTLVCVSYTLPVRWFLPAEGYDDNRQYL